MTETMIPEYIGNGVTMLSKTNIYSPLITTWCCFTDTDVYSMSILLLYDAVLISVA